MRYVTERQNIDNHTRTWSAKVVMALATVMKITGIRLLDEDIQVMLPYLCLKKDLCDYVVSKMNQSVRSVSIEIK